MDVTQIDNINNGNNHYVYFYKTIYLILINQNDSMKCINNVCRSVWKKCGSMDNCILVTMNDKCCCKKQSEIALLSKKWNVPSVPVDCHERNSSVNLFKFAMKHYWFCEVMKYS
eukprot:UN01838